MSLRAAAVSALLAAMACSLTDEELPPVQAKRPGVSMPAVCDQLPVRVAYERPVLLKLDNLRDCLSHSELATAGRNATPWPVTDPKVLPVMFWVQKDGRVAEGLSFWNQCSGTFFAVDARTRACLQRALSAWRYAPDVEGCPLRYFAQEHYYYVDVAPRGAEGDVVLAVGHSGCS